MATLTNPVNAQNIVDRFADYVVATANAGISWGTNALPTYSDGTVVVPSSQFGGTTSGRSIGITGSDITATPITANNIFDGLRAETQRYSNIRNLRAILNVTGGGGNSGSRPTAGVVYDQTAVAHMEVGYRTSTNVASYSGLSTGNVISASNLEGFFDTLRTEYNRTRGLTYTYQTDVCHASCHSNCHSSRGRR